MRKFLAFLSGNWQIMNEYRMDLIFWTLSGIIVPFIGLAIWLSASGNSSSLIYSRSDLIIYFLSIALINILTSAWSSWFIAEKIIDGGFSKYLYKPIPLILDELAENFAEKFFKIFIILVPILLIAYFLRGSMKPVTLDPQLVIIFLIALINAFAISFLLELSAGLASFWVSEIDFLNSIIYILQTLFMGSFIPLVFLPSFLYQIAIALPFRYIASFPVEVLLGKLSRNEMILGLALSFFWVGASIMIYKLLFKFGTRIYQGYGG